MRTFPQAQTFGALFRGIDAVTPTGTAAAFALVADFTGTIETRFAAPSVAIPVTHTPSQTEGSRFHVNVEGMWSARVMFVKVLNQSIGLAVGLDLLPAQLNTDPFSLDERLLDFGEMTGGPACSVQVWSGPRAITRDMANDPTRGIWQIIAGNILAPNTGMTAAAVGGGFATNCAVTFLRHGPLPADMNR